MSQQINLFNPIFLKQKKQFSAVTMLQGLALIFLGSIAVMVYARIQLSGLGGEAVESAARLKATQAQLAKVSAQYAPRQKSKALEQEIQKTEADLTVERQILDVMQEGNFGKAPGYSAYFRALARQIVDGLWLTGFTIVGAGNGIELHGRALRPELVPEYINRLKREPVMEGKSFSALQMDVPSLETANKKGSVSGPPRASGDTGRAPANYVEFSLHSSKVSDALSDAKNELSSSAALSRGDGK